MAPREAPSTAFKKGESGNPAGRPKGCKDRRKELTEKLNNASPELVDNAIRLANAGDSSMMRCCLERIFPKKREATYISLPGLREAKTYSDKCAIIDKALADKDLSIEIWELMHKTFARTFEVEELDRRIEQLEVNAGLKEKVVDKRVINKVGPPKKKK